MDLYGEFLGGDEPDIYDVLRDLDQKKIIKDWKYSGDHPTCEEEFNERFTKIIPGERGLGVEVKDPSKFGITYQEVMSHYNKIINDFNAIKVVRQRKYPKIENQLDNLYHDIKNNNLSNGEWIKSIDKVKADYPKPIEK